MIPGTKIDVVDDNGSVLHAVKVQVKAAHGIPNKRIVCQRNCHGDILTACNGIYLPRGEGFDGTVDRVAVRTVISPCGVAKLDRFGGTDCRPYKL